MIEKAWYSSPQGSGNCYRGGKTGDINYILRTHSDTFILHHTEESSQSNTIRGPENYHGKGLITPHVPRESRGMLCAGSVLVACQGEVVVKYSGINITGACDRVNIELCVAMLSDSHYYCMDIFIVVICC